MSDRAHIGLDNPAFRGRLRQPSGPAQSSRVPDSIRPSARYSSDFALASSRASLAKHSAYKHTAVHSGSAPVKVQAAVQPIKTTDFLSPKQLSKQHAVPRPTGPVAFDVHKPQRSQVLKRPVLHQQAASAVLVPAHRVAGTSPSKATHAPARKKRFNYSRGQLAVMVMAVTVFLVGIMVSILTLRTNHSAATQVAALSKASQDQPATSDATAAPGVQNPSTPPSTTRPTSHAVSTYTVGPNMPRYLDIPRFGVHARVLSLGILNSGALATPNNVFDVGWYNETSLPGQPGAMLFDGHVSSWTAHGVFYHLKDLVPGDQIKVERGDGQVFTYQVVKSQTFDHDNVDMDSAVRPVDPNKPGLNLITCTGDVIRGTNEFNERILVYASQV